MYSLTDRHTTVIIHDNRQYGNLYKGMLLGVLIGIFLVALTRSR